MGSSSVLRLLNRPASVHILEAPFKAEAGDDAAAIAGLRKAASQTRSIQLRRAIGSHAGAIASRLQSAGPGCSLEPSAVGQEAAKLAEEMLPLTASFRDALPSVPSGFSSDRPSRGPR